MAEHEGKVLRDVQLLYISLDVWPGPYSRIQGSQLPEISLFGREDDDGGDAGL